VSLATTSRRPPRWLCAAAETLREPFSAWLIHLFPTPHKACFATATGASVLIAKFVSLCSERGTNFAI
jgi:hypothetical protein